MPPVCLRSLRGNLTSPNMLCGYQLAHAGSVPHAIINVPSLKWAVNPGGVASATYCCSWLAALCPGLESQSLCWQNSSGGGVEEPHQVLLDGEGVLKLSNFCLSRTEGETLEDLFTMLSLPDQAGCAEGEGDEETSESCFRKRMQGPASL
ncbi:hypothetical protein NHX12_001704 [Muraenolepis orangiensis]|uniref:Uncharacterized protein n=1 Tax=Muraenolepis orangiensis TaxID=630683 RepID=A0A9Q0E1D9_9TELE|nr:hypothetical protein NHX12_001704 [Muraenolepis orangiensis]